MSNGQKATLKNSTAYVDDDYPALVFLVPKYVDRQWRATDFETPDTAKISVQMSRSQTRDPLLLLDLPSRALLRLRPRARRALGSSSGGVLAQVRSLLITDQRGRCAEVEIALLSFPE